MQFLYAQDQPLVLKGIDLEIRRGERIGLIGSTGSGRLDILMGLLEPSEGRVLVDGADLHDPIYPERLLAWRAYSSRAPSIFLSIVHC